MSSNTHQQIEDAVSKLIIKDETPGDKTASPQMEDTPGDDEYKRKYQQANTIAVD